MSRVDLCFLNPCCLLERSSFRSMYAVNLLFSSFSRSLPGWGSKEIG